MLKIPTDIPQELFWVNVNKTDSCWNWTGRTSSHGYGLFQWKLFGYYAHRISYEWATGQPFPEGLISDHLCRNRLCVNPAHIEPVTAIVNILRGESPPARNARKTHCPKGHPLTEANLLKNSTGKSKRACRFCDILRKRREYLIRSEGVVKRRNTPGLQQRITQCPK